MDDFAAVVEVVTDAADFPRAERTSQGVVVYDAGALCAADQHEVRAELARVLLDGPGIFVLEGAVPEDVVDRTTAVFEAMIADQRATASKAGDHFAKPGANDRVWNALEKLARRDPDAFVDYYANAAIALAALAWLGPGYQVTSQVNVVNPGGEAQLPHRDYHLGFMTIEEAAEFPAHVHHLSAALTLQGAVAHCDMPVESGPTMYLPYSHQYVPGYLAWRLPAFRDHFAQHYVQLPLTKGDAVFFNPALFHGAGTNVSADVQRVANLLQVSSAFGRAMETVDRDRVVRAVYPVLLDRKAAGTPDAELGHALAAAAEGYPFPTNLDLDQPVGGMTPASQAELAADALASGVRAEDLAGVLDDYAARRATS